MQATSWAQNSCASSLSERMIYELAELHLEDVLHLIRPNEKKTGRGIRCVDGAPLCCCCSVLRSGGLNSSVCGGGLWRGRGLSSQSEGMERSDAPGCFLLVILGLGGAGTRSKHFPEDRKSKQKQVHRPGDPQKRWIRVI